MNHNAGIQFFGIDSVVKAYASNGVAPFALWAGKLQLLKYDGNSPDGYQKPTIAEGQQLLNDYLCAMYEGTTAIYTLRTYEDLKDGEKIKPSTEYDTAFNFKINVQGQDAGVGSTGRGNSLVLEELRKINSRIDVLEIGDEDDEDERDIIGTVNHLLQEPEKLREVVDSVSILGDVVKSIFGLPVQPRAQIGNVNRVSDISSEQHSMTDKLGRLEKALDTLEKHDSKIVDHLEKLARMAQSNPNKFKSLIGMLELMG